MPALSWGERKGKVQTRVSLPVQICPWTILPTEGSGTTRMCALAVRDSVLPKKLHLDYGVEIAPMGVVASKPGE